MLSSSTFREWLFGQEILEFLSFRRLVESLDDGFRATIDKNNLEFNHLLGFQKNWFAIILGFAVRRVRGADALVIAQETADDMIMSMHSKTDAFYAAMAPLVQKGNENEIAALFTAAAAMRVRKHSGRYKRKRDSITTHMSAFDKDGTGNKFIEPADSNPGPLEDKGGINDLMRDVQIELERMAATTKDPRSQARLRRAKDVAVKRMENAPNFPSLGDLLTMFPDISKPTMYVILQDIQTAFQTVAQSQGMENIVGSIERIKRKKKKTG
jgi:hypothetical protein